MFGVMPEKSRFTKITDFYYDHMRHKEAWSSAEAEPVDNLDALHGRKYALLTTYRKSGEPVPSPVWFGIGADGNVYFNTEAAAGKVKRIRNNATVRIAPCASNGKPLGPPAVGSARVLTADEADRAESAIAANYGRGRRIYERVGRRMSIDAVYVEIVPALSGDQQS